VGCNLAGPHAEGQEGGTTIMDTYESKRVAFAILEKKYKEYLNLYRMVNNGSIKGATKFEDFYWDETYYSKYPANGATTGRGQN
jgi:hypothetical protein